MCFETVSFMFGLLMSLKQDIYIDLQLRLLALLEYDPQESLYTIKHQNNYANENYSENIDGSVCL